MLIIMLRYYTYTFFVLYIGLNLEKTGESRSTSIQLTVAVSSTVAAFIVISLLTIFALLDQFVVTVL